LKALQGETTAKDFYTREQNEVQTTLTKVTKMEAILETTMERWMELEEMQNT